MKKSYILFALVLVVLILAFTFSRSYLSSLEQTAKGTGNQMVSRATLDSLERELKVRFNEYEAFVDLRIDSLERKYREGATPSPGTSQDSGVKTPAQIPVRENEKSANGSGDSSSKKKNKPETKSPAKAIAPTEEELAIYQEYLKRRLELPADLSAYELKVAKNELLMDIGKAHSLDVQQVLDVVDKVYEFRRKGNRN